MISLTERAFLSKRRTSVLVATFSQSE